MAAETAIVFAIVTGRVLVLPHKKKFYLLDRNRKDGESIIFGLWILLMQHSG